MNEQTEERYTAAEAKTFIIQQLRKISGVNFSKNLPKVLRCQAKIPPLNPLKWLSLQEETTRFYFRGRDENAKDSETAGAGVADVIFFPKKLDYRAAFTHMRKYLTPDYPDLNYYGGFSFAPGHIDADWKTFGACHFFIPRFQLIIKEKEAFFVCHVIPANETPKSIAKIISQLEKMNFTEPAEPTEPTEPAELADFPEQGKPISRTDYPNHDQWLKTLARVIDEIKKKQYLKTVLARKVELLFEKSLDPVAVLAALEKMSSRRYDFLFQFEPQTAFLGSSPEQLYKRKGQDLVSEAIAGTRSRGKNSQEDMVLAEELLNSKKDRQEHDFVIDAIAQNLRPLCTSLDVDSKKSLLTLKEGIHLISHVKGTLKPGINDEMVISALHPTPAVGGCPLPEALTVIRESEPFKRGWYAGLIGAVGYETADFAVALRSALVKKNRVFLYSGVGIVEDSIPEEEWREVDDKILNFMNIFNPTGQYLKP